MGRYCSICRGEDDLHGCRQCKRLFHEECAKISRDEMKSIAEWLCGDCAVMSDTEITSRKRGRDELKDKFKNVRLWHFEILEERKRFLSASKELLLPFCDEKKLDNLITRRSTKRENAPSPEDLSIYETPGFIMAELRGYQLEGVSTLLSWAQRGIGGILGDEMGLGKTIQTISFLAVLKDRLGISGPHLVITPLAVLQNWANEISRFAPELTFKKVYGSQMERDYLFTDEETLSGNFDVYLTTYETVMTEESFFTECWPWATVTVDEGHRLKSDTTNLRRAIARVRSPFRLLLTGTPLQNDLHELWSLLNFILPDVFAKSTSFDDGVHINNDVVNRETCMQARALLENGLMVRRLKVDVETVLLPKIYRNIYVGMTDVQKRWYRAMLKRDNDTNGTLSFSELLMLMAELQKVVNHPKQIYTAREKQRRIEYSRVEKAVAEGAEYCSLDKKYVRPAPGTVSYTAEEELRTMCGELLVKSCGKLAMLDRLLISLKQKGSRVLLFSQYTQTLNILEEYLSSRFGPLQKAYLRLDGTTTRINRELDQRSFNAPGSDIFLYLISTKAGGMGINLATADTVVLYEPCWNPQVELQAEDRAHRIGQKKQVVIYKFVTKDTFEERVQIAAEKKLMLDHVVIAKKGTATTEGCSRLRSGRKKVAKDEEKLSLTELWGALKHGAKNVFHSAGNEDVLLSDADLDKFIEKVTSTSTDSEQPSSDEQCRSQSIEADEKVEVQGVSTIFDLAEPSNATEELAIMNADSDPEDAGYSEILLIPAVEEKSDRGTLSDTVALLDNDINPEVDDHAKEKYEIDPTPRKRARVQPKRFAPAIVKSKQSYRKKTHDSDCFCCDDGGEVLECNVCPKVYHLDCIGLKNVPKGRWACPWHSCFLCQRSSTACGGMLLRCIECPMSYCLDCFPKTEEMTQIFPSANEIAYFEKHGFPLPPNAVFYRCTECKEEKEKKIRKMEAEKKAQEEARAAAEAARRKYREIKNHDVVNTSRKTVQFVVTLYKDAMGKLGINLKAHAVTKQVFVDSVPSHCAELRPHDQVIGVNGIPTPTLFDVVQCIGQSYRAVTIYAVRRIYTNVNASDNQRESTTSVVEGADLITAENAALRGKPIPSTINRSNAGQAVTVKVKSAHLFLAKFENTMNKSIVITYVPADCDTLTLGDKILRINGQTIWNAPVASAIINAIKSVGHEYCVLELMPSQRESKEMLKRNMHIYVHLERLPDNTFGFSVRGTPEADSVEVVSVASTVRTLLLGDRITSINGDTVYDVKAFVPYLQDLNIKVLVLQVRREDRIEAAMPTVIDVPMVRVSSDAKVPQRSNVVPSNKRTEETIVTASSTKTSHISEDERAESTWLHLPRLPNGTFGFSVQNTPEKDSVEVVSVADKGSALLLGDRITSINGVAVNNTADVLPFLPNMNIQVLALSVRSHHGKRFSKGVGAIEGTKNSSEEACLRPNFAAEKVAINAASLPTAQLISECEGTDSAAVDLARTPVQACPQEAHTDNTASKKVLEVESYTGRSYNGPSDGRSEDNGEFFADDDDDIFAIAALIGQTVTKLRPGF